jgi:hypothetical protein
MFPDVWFRGIPVRPINIVEFARTADGMVPLKLPAVRLVRFAPDTAPKEPDQVPLVIVPTEVKEEPVTPEASVLPERVPAAAVTVMFAEPSKDTPFMVRAVSRIVAVPAFR